MMMLLQQLMKLINTMVTMPVSRNRVSPKTEYPGDKLLYPPSRKITHRWIKKVTGIRYIVLFREVYN